MTVLTTSDLIIGLQGVWIAPKDTANPFALVALPGAWVQLGKNGLVDYAKPLVVKNPQTMYEPMSQGSTVARGISRLTEDFSVSGSIYDMTQEAMDVIRGGTAAAQTAAATGVPGYKLRSIQKGTVVTKYAVLIQTVSGYDPNDAGLFMRIWIPAAANIAPGDFSLDKGAAAEQQFEFKAFFSGVAASTGTLRGLGEILECNADLI